jgi:hypothetical protein
MKTRVLTVAIVLLSCGSAFATVSRTFNSEQVFGLVANGTFILDNPVGNVEIFGKDTANVEASLYKTIDGTDADSVQEGREQTRLIVSGNDNVRMLRMGIAPGSTHDWTASVSWRVFVPRTANLRIVSRAGDHIKVSGMRGQVQIKNVNGRVIVDDVTSSALVESVNGSIFPPSTER